MRSVTVGIIVTLAMWGLVGQAQPARPSWNSVKPHFQMFCGGCHTQYTQQTIVEANRDALYDRMKWLETGTTPVDRDMPSAGNLRTEIQKPANAEKRKALLAFLKPSGGSSSTHPVEALTVDPAYKIKLWAKVPGARSLAMAGDGTLFVATGGFSNPLDKIYRIRDWNRDGAIGNDEIETLISGLNNPNGIALKGNDLYVAEISQILLFSNVLNAARNTPILKSAARVLPQRFPNDRHHGWKFIRFAPAPDDNWLYVPVGAPCNICKSPPVYSAIHRIDVTGSTQETVAKGVRNTVGFDFHPRTKNLWFTDNGRDELGNDTPPDELNEVTTKGEHFGYPYCHGRGIVDPSIGFDSAIRSCAQTTPAKVELGPHVAALGMRFYKDQIVIAEHGSWNRSRKSGYRVMWVTLPGTGAPQYKPLVTGWLNESTQKAWGRPVDVELTRDGGLLISDDGISGTGNTGAVYLLSPR
jgi:glucose/arabinose dehydrogenase